jgi:hypothetical protein
MNIKSVYSACSLILALGLVGGCRASASAHAGSASSHEREQREHRAHRASGNEHAPAPSAASGALTRDETASPSSEPAGDDAHRAEHDGANKTKKQSSAASKREDGDHDRGHGNDADGVDEDNPGKSKKHD